MEAILAYLTGDVERAVWMFVCIAEGVLIWRLFTTRLCKSYKFFTWYLIAELARSTIGAFLDVHSVAYMALYATSLPVVCGLTLLACVELYGLVLKDYPAIRATSTMVLNGALAAAVVISSALLYADFMNADGQSVIVLSVFAIQRAFYSTLLFFLVLAMVYVLWFPVPLQRNAVVHTLLFAVFFSGQSLLMLFRNLIGVEWMRVLSTVSLLLELSCVLGWILLLSPKGQAATVVVGHRWNQRDADQLVGQLGAINETLLRTARK